MNRDDNISKKRYGFTTGSCATVATKAAATMLLSGMEIKKMSIVTPGEKVYEAEITEILRSETGVRCGVVKNGGDDPDVTSGYTVFADVTLTEKKEYAIDGGEGVGRVTRPGLDQPVGNAAINSVPRQMITDALKQVSEDYDYEGGFDVVISVPGGEELAKKTFNPRLGIEGGISIIGTSGIVEPMSVKAILDTIKVEMNQKVAMGNESIVMAPGNYGIDFIKNNYDFDLEKAVKCSNYIGESIDLAAECGIKKILLVGHIGKLIKVSGGIMNTHSKEADCRMELMAAAAIKCGMQADAVSKILDCLTTDEAYQMIKQEKLEDAFVLEVMKKIDNHLKKRAQGRLEIECIMFSNENGLLGETVNAHELLEECRRN